MAVTSVPGWIGSSAVDETGERWMQAAGIKLRLGSAFWMSSMAGRSREITFTLGANHNYNPDDLINQLRSIGSVPARVEIVGDLVAYSTGVPCLSFPGDLANEYIHLRINGVTVYGRGGQGGTAGVNVGQNGGHCIFNGIGGRLRIENNGAICGGGGGGGGARVGSNLVSGGSGGRPFGPAGIGEGRDKKDGYAATLGEPGPTPPATRYDSQGGAGGQVGQAGATSTYPGGQGSAYPGGAPGHAVYGSSPQWLATGAIYGPWI